MESFPIRVKELTDMMQSQLKPFEQHEHLMKHGGIEGLCQKLRTSLRTGLEPSDQDDLRSRQAHFGRNEIPVNPPKSILALMWDALHDTTLVILLICAITSLGVSFYHDGSSLNDEEYPNSKNEINVEWIEGLAILITVIVIVFVTSYNDWSKERQFRKLQSKIESDQCIRVLRGGSTVQLPIKEILVGDICEINYGHIIPADGIVVESNDLKVDESSLTGESDLIKKGYDQLMLFSGTHVMEGRAKMLVTAVGSSSQAGLIMSLINETEDKSDVNEAVEVAVDGGDEAIELKSKENNQTRRDSSEVAIKKKSKPKSGRKEQSILQAKLNKLTMQIGYAGLPIAIGTLLILIARYCITEYAIEHKQFSSAIIRPLVKFFITSVTVLVVAVPEGLPLAVTIALAYAVRKMMSDNNLVRHIDACETMGNATTICSDKTGTLTTNRMTVVQCHLDGKYFDEQLPEASSVPEKIRTMINLAISVNSNYTSLLEASNSGGLPTQHGNKTECALLGFVQNMGGDYAKIRESYPTKEYVHVYTFNSARKTMSTCVKHPSTPEGVRLFCKGASEIVLGRCKYIMEGEKIRDFTEEDYQKMVDQVIEPMASSGLRTICLAYKDYVPTSQLKNRGDVILPKIFYWDEEEKEITSDLVCIGICGIQDPVRPEVPEVIRKCTRAGIVVRMVTGDNVNTARSIALSCGIIDPNDNFLVLESGDFNKKIKNENGKICQEKFDQVWPRLRVLARSSPQDKYNLVKHIIASKLDGKQEIVAVTGDGTNDGPALKKADVGFAMGIQGTDVAKEASDIIITDDNFTSIVKSVIWGRNVYDAISRFLQFQMTVNVTAVIVAFVGSCAVGQSPLRAVQMLWVNLIMDTLASFTLVTEPPTEGLLNRKPYGRTQALISKTMMKHILGHMFYQLTIIFVLLSAGPTLFDIESGIGSFQPTQHFTMIFNSFVLMTLFNQINSRKLHGEHNVFERFFSSPIIYATWILELTMQVLLINFGSHAFGCQPLSLELWTWCFLFGVGSLLWGQVVISIPEKWLPEKLQIG